ncbi:MAG: hypothetical protein C0501_16290 [Isosphaera sp.]|nr:hypothetical protein [Isosphaera sp.]
MRPACLALVSAAAACAGCAGLVAGHGLDPDSLYRSRIEEIATPGTVTADEDGSVRFRTCRKVAEPERADRYWRNDLGTFWLAEVPHLPHELYRAARTNLSGQDVTVAYTDLGFVSAVWVDGHAAYFRPIKPDDPAYGRPATAAYSGGRPGEPRPSGSGCSSDTPAP